MSERVRLERAGLRFYVGGDTPNVVSVWNPRDGYVGAFHVLDYAGRPSNAQIVGAVDQYVLRFAAPNSGMLPPVFAQALGCGCLVWIAAGALLMVVLAALHIP